MNRWQEEDIVTLLYNAFRYIDNHGTGYRVTADETQRPFREIRAEWKVPTLLDSGTDERILDVWVGIEDDEGADRLVQTGVEFRRVNGQQENRAWWESYPENQPQYFPGQNPAIASGDTITAKVVYSSDSDIWQFYIGVRPENGGQPRLYEAEHPANEQNNCGRAVVMMETKLPDTLLAKFSDIKITDVKLRDRNRHQHTLAMLHPEPFLVINERSCLLAILTPIVDDQSKGYPFTLVWQRAE